MRRSGLVAFVASVATFALVAAAPALAATSYVQVPLSSVANAVIMMDNGNTAPSTTASNSACHNVAGATFGNSNGLSATGLPVGQTVKDPNGVPYSIPEPSVKDAVCVTTADSTKDPGPTTITIPVPAGQYSDAYFLASVENGPSLVSITPVYGTTNGTPIQAVFDDWCAPILSGGALTPDATTMFPHADPRLNNLSGTVKDSTPLPCTVYSTHVPGLDSSKTLTGLTISLAAASTAVPSETGASGKTESPNGVLNIMALTLEGTQTSAASTTTTTTSSTKSSSTTATTTSSTTPTTSSTTTSTSSKSTSSSLPKTGSGPLPAVLGGVLLLGGAALVRRPWAGRS